MTGDKRFQQAMDSGRCQWLMFEAFQGQIQPGHVNAPRLAIYQVDAGIGHISGRVRLFMAVPGWNR